MNNIIKGLLMFIIGGIFLYPALCLKEYIGIAFLFPSIICIFCIMTGMCLILEPNDAKEVQDE